MQNIEKMIEKIQNLLDLANNNPNENESIAAALKAQELMAKYNIEVEEVRQAPQDEEIIRDIIKFDKNTGYCIKWRFNLAKIIATNFKVKTWSIGKDDVAFYGFKSDVQIAVSVFNFLFSTGNKLSCKYYYQCKNEGKPTKGVMNEWLMGFIQGLADVLEKQCTALMIVVPKKVEEEYKEVSKGFVTVNRTISRSYDPRAFEDGRTEGRATANARSIEATV